MNKREFFRVHFPDKLCSKCAITKINNQPPARLVEFRVCVKNISASGAGFETSYKLPAKAPIELQLSFKIDHKEWQMNGYIVRKEELDNGLYSYGMQFRASMSAQSELHKSLSRLQIFISRNTSITSCRFCQKKVGCPNKAEILTNEHSLKGPL